MLQVYYSILVIIEYAIPLLVMTVAYIKMGRRLWGAKTPGQVSRESVYESPHWSRKLGVHVGQMIWESMY